MYMHAHANALNILLYSNVFIHSKQLYSIVSRYNSVWNHARALNVNINTLYFNVFTQDLNYCSYCFMINEFY